MSEASVLRELRELDRKEIERLRAALTAAYDDAKTSAINPMLYEEGDGPLDLQRKIAQAIDYRKRCAL